MGFTPVIVALLLKATPVRWVHKFNLPVDENITEHHSGFAEKFTKVNNTKIDLKALKQKLKKKDGNEETSQLKESLI